LDAAVQTVGRYSDALSHRRPRSLDRYAARARRSVWVIGAANLYDEDGSLTFT
jgi:hypothetical protein